MTPVQSVRLSGEIPSIFVGRTAATASPEVSVSDTTFGRPPQLEDRAWLARRYSQVGDRAIAKELGCARSTVVAARRRLGIAPTADGRRRGGSAASASEQVSEIRPMGLTGSLAEAAHHFQEDQRTRAPATDELLIARCRGWLDAKQHHDQLAIEDALLSIASAALLIHEHSVKLRKAA